MRVRLSRLVLSIGLAAATSACDSAGRLPTSPTPVATPQPAPTPPPNPPPTGVPSTGISVDQVLRTTVSVEDPVCDPQHWDARAPCKVFTLVVPRSGVLTVTVTILVPTLVPGSTADLLDLMVTLLPDGPTEYVSGGAVQRVSLDAAEGRSYVIRINSYQYMFPSVPPAVEFELKTELK